MMCVAFSNSAALFDTAAAWLPLVTLKNQKFIFALADFCRWIRSRTLKVKQRSNGSLDARLLFVSYLLVFEEEAGTLANSSSEICGSFAWLSTVFPRFWMFCVLELRGNRRRITTFALYKDQFRILKRSLFNRYQSWFSAREDSTRVSLKNFQNLVLSPLKAPRIPEKFRKPNQVQPRAHTPPLTDCRPATSPTRTPII